VAASAQYTFVIADLAGYTALTEAHGGAEAAKTVARYTELAQRALGPGVRLAERVGDQVLFVGGDPGDAVTTALRLKDAVDREPLFLGVRIGIAAGAAVEQGGRYFGPALNVAARVAAHAGAGQILCTGHVAAAVRGISDIRCVAVGPVRFKNVSEPVEIFEIVSEECGRGVLDPVCHMRVEAATAPARLPFNGTTYYFCSFACAEAFTKKPPAYLEP
jgi:class 3 adenylate cyclase/YHS domain-containing protein